MGEKPGILLSSDAASKEPGYFFSSFAEPCLFLEADLQIIKGNVAAENFLKLSSSQLASKKLSDLLDIADDQLAKLTYLGSAWVRAGRRKADGETELINCLWMPLPQEVPNQSLGVLIFPPSANSSSIVASDLEQARKAEEDFIYSISHDLRAPLRAIQGFSNLLTRELEENCTELASTYLKRMVTAADRMEAYMNDLLILSRVTRTETLLRPIQLEPILNSVREDLGSLIEKQGAILEVQEPLKPVAGMTTLCQHLLFQLLHNALNYPVEGQPPQIQIKSELLTNGIRITVADNGIGIKPEHQQKIFKPFERLHSADTHPGTGLGLAIVQRAMAKMSGTVTVESELGKGSRFYLHFQTPETLRSPV
ncbi:MAG: sensor histidine kinase [Verrucomicrobiales bacterium]